MGWLSPLSPAEHRCQAPHEIAGQLVARGPTPFKGRKAAGGTSGDPADLTLRTRLDYF